MCGMQPALFLLSGKGVTENAAVAGAAVVAWCAAALCLTLLFKHAGHRIRLISVYYRMPFYVLCKTPDCCCPCCAVQVLA
jgi:hypothetical protein